MTTLVWTIKVYQLKHGYKVFLKGMSSTAIGKGPTVEAALQWAQNQLIYKAPFEVAK